MTEINYRFLQEFVYRESGIVIEKDKHYLIETRLSPVARATDLGSLNALCDALRAPDPQLRQQVIDAMTTNETLWFRESAHFEILRTTILPELAKARQPSRQLSVWSAAASSGQELYSVAMTLLESGFSEWDLKLLGTDLSAQMVERARAGRYLQLEVNRGLPAACLEKYFERDRNDWRLIDRVRRLARFERFDLRQPAVHLGRFDIVLCRNVLIYFDGATKRRILSEIAKTLLPGGYLLLGTAETILNLDVPFERKSIGQTIVYQAA